jgi:tetratricopeptide (TPR) repeat protein
MKPVFHPCLCLLAALVIQARAGDPLADFGAHVGELKTVSETVRQAIADELKSADTPARRAAAIPRSLAALYPEYRAALAAQSSGDFAQASAALRKLTGGSDAARDRFLAAYARLDAARVETGRENYNRAMQFVEETDRSHRAQIADPAELDFLRVVCEVKLLRREQARKHAEAFLATYPDASPAMVKPMRRILSEIGSTKDGSLQDVRDHMVAAGSYLNEDREDAAKAIALQARVGKMLTTIIGDGKEEDKAQTKEDSAASKPKEEKGPDSRSGQSNRDDKGPKEEESNRKLQRLQAKKDDKQTGNMPNPKSQQQQKQGQQQGQQQSSGQGKPSSESKDQSIPGGKQGEGGGSAGQSAVASGIGQATVGASQSALVGGDSGGPAGDGVGVSRVAGERWGSMPPKERDRVLSVVSASFPEAYRDLIEQYYRGLMDGKGPAEEVNSRQ